MFMGKAPRCDCGYEIRADDDVARVTEIRRHALDAHGIDFTRGDALAVLLRTELEAGETRPRPTKGRSRS